MRSLWSPMFQCNVGQQSSHEKTGRLRHSWTKSWLPTIVLAQHQQPDGQLAISSGQVGAHGSEISQSNPCFLFPFILLLPSILYALLPLWQPPALQLFSLRGRSSVRGPQKPDGIYSFVSVCVRIVACVYSSQTTSYRTTKAAGLRFSFWHQLSHAGMCQASHSYTQTHTPLLSRVTLNADLKWCPVASQDRFVHINIKYLCCTFSLDF